ncbi:unnamed protein product, partial [Prunus brigantina]
GSNQRSTEGSCSFRSSTRCWPWGLVLVQDQAEARVFRSQGDRAEPCRFRHQHEGHTRCSLTSRVLRLSEPLLELIASLGPKEKVILVGHSLGGMNLPLAMERFPQKISAAVFLTAFLPDTTHQPSYIMDEFMQKIPADSWLDTQFEQFGSATKEPLTSIFFGPNYLQANLYQLSPIEDLELAKSLVRKSSFFREEVAKMKNFSNE